MMDQADSRHIVQSAYIATMGDERTNAVRTQ
jgi:hypothetical protein